MSKQTYSNSMFINKVPGKKHDFNYLFFLLQIRFKITQKHAKCLQVGSKSMFIFFYFEHCILILNQRKEEEKKTKQKIYRLFKSIKIKY